jgi:erythromycin esterase-like protein
VWAHNSHVGNAAATDMGRRGQFNIGELCREHFGDRAVAIGFGTDHGTVAAASHWDGPMEVKEVRPAHPKSYGALCRETDLPAFLLDVRAEGRDELRDVLSEPRLERFIGVIYRPETELVSHYSRAELARQFDAYVWFEQTRAVRAIAAGAGQQRRAI